MSTLQNQITQSLEGLSDDSLSFILEMIQRFVMPAESKSMAINHDIAIKKKKILPDNLFFPILLCVILVKECYSSRRSAHLRTVTKE